MSTEDLTPEEEAELDELACEVRLTQQKDMELEIFGGLKGDSGNPVTPVRLDATDSFCFSCHPGVSCWNQCCHGADITLTPKDILTLSAHLGIRPAEFLTQYTVPADFARTNLPVAKLKMGGDDGRGPCPFMTEPGCSVYEARPATCRYYPLGMVSMKMKDSEDKENFHFLVRESHCQGHKEPHEQTVGAYRAEQGVDAYDDLNRGWVDILMKMASWSSIGGVGGKAPTPQTRRMFFMVSTDVDAFRAFVFGSRFLEMYEVDPEVVDILRTDDEALLRLGFDWMKNVLFNEPTLGLKAPVLQEAIARARRELSAGG